MSFSKSLWFGRVVGEVEVMGSIVQLGSRVYASFQQNVRTFIDNERVTMRWQIDPAYNAADKKPTGLETARGRGSAYAHPGLENRDRDLI